MFSYLKQSTASQGRIVGPFVDDTDFVTVETALTILNTDVKLSKNAAAAVNKTAGGGTHIVNGNYSLTFDATDTNTVGELHVSINVTGAMVVVAKFWVLEEDIYDALFGASANGFDAAGTVSTGANGVTLAAATHGGTGASLTLDFLHLIGVTGTNEPLRIQGHATGADDTVFIQSNKTAGGRGLRVDATGTQPGILVNGGATNGNGIEVGVSGTGDALLLSVADGVALSTAVSGTGEHMNIFQTVTIPELTGAPGATPTVFDAIMLPYMSMRNKLDVTATLKEVHNDAGTVVSKKTLSDDGTTYSEAEMVDGP